MGIKRLRGRNLRPCESLRMRQGARWTGACRYRAHLPPPRHHFHLRVCALLLLRRTRRTSRHRTGRRENVNRFCSCAKHKEDKKTRRRVPPYGTRPWAKRLVGLRGAQAHRQPPSTHVSSASVSVITVNDKQHVITVNDKQQAK